MRILKVTRLMPEGPFFLFCGVVEGSRGARLLDEGKPGQSVRLMLRRTKTAKLDAAAVVAIEKPAAA